MHRESQGNADSRVVTPPLRAVHESRPPDEPLNDTPQDNCEIQDPRAEQTEASERAVQAYRDWRALPRTQRPLAVAHEALFKFVDETLHARWLRGDEALSNTAIARSCGCDEKQVREWREGEKRLPLAALLCAPPSLVVEILTWISERRGLGRIQRPVAALADVLDRLDRPVPPADVQETKRALRQARDRIVARLDRLEEEGK